jgi:hypothetical protein
MSSDGDRFVLLNYLVSRSSTRARRVAAPTHSARELLDVLSARCDRNWTVEFIGGQDERDEATRISVNEGFNFIRLKKLRFDESNGHHYACLLFQYVDVAKSSFQVVNIRTFEGRQISGGQDERGGVYAHLVVRLPNPGEFDDGMYRCVLEAAPSISRSLIQHLIAKQMRRDPTYGALSFNEPIHYRRKPPGSKPHDYSVKLDLLADIGRKLTDVSSNRVLTKMQFTKRSAHQNTATQMEVEHVDFVADLQVVVSANQGPTDPVERLGWAAQLKAHYDALGYVPRFFFRSESGDVDGGDIHPAIASATDLLVCPRERVFYPEEARGWSDELNESVLTVLRPVLDRDELWHLAK